MNKELRNKDTLMVSLLNQFSKQIANHNSRFANNVYNKYNNNNNNSNNNNNNNNNNSNNNSNNDNYSHKNNSYANGNNDNDCSSFDNNKSSHFHNFLDNITLTISLKLNSNVNHFNNNFGDNNFGQWRRSGVFIVNFEHISHLVLVFLLLTLNM